MHIHHKGHEDKNKYDIGCEWNLKLKSHTDTFNHNSTDTTLGTAFEETFKLNNGCVWHQMTFKCENMGHKQCKKI